MSFRFAGFSSLLALAALLSSCGTPRNPAVKVWLAPNIGSPDTIDMFGQPQRWRAARQSTDVFKFYEQQILADRPSDCPECARNIFPELSRAAAFTRVNSWNLAIGVEVGVLKPWACAAAASLPLALEAVRRIETRTAIVSDLAMDEPLLGAQDDCQLTLDEAARQTADFARGASETHPYLKVGDIEPYPILPASTLLDWVDALRREGYVPAFFHLDVDRVHAARIGADVAGDLALLRSRLEGQGIPFGVIFWSDVGTSDEAYSADVLAWVGTVKAAIGEPTQSVFQSWAVSPDGSRSVPRNLPEADPAVFSHTRLLDDGLAALRSETPPRSR
jgi:hypothetical protein